MPADLYTAFLRAYFAFHRVDMVERVLVRMQNDGVESGGQLPVDTLGCLPTPPLSCHSSISNHIRGLYGHLVILLLVF